MAFGIQKQFNISETGQDTTVNTKVTIDKQYVLLVGAKIKDMVR